MTQAEHEKLNSAIYALEHIKSFMVDLERNGVVTCTAYIDLAGAALKLAGAE
jgi:hypothetical protein